MSGKSADGAVPSGSGCKGPPPSPSKTSGEMKNLHLEHTLSTDQADDAPDFVNWQEPPQDVCERIEAQEDRMTAQTSASMTQFRNHLSEFHKSETDEHETEIMDTLLVERSHCAVAHARCWKFQHLVHWNLF